MLRRLLSAAYLGLRQVVRPRSDKWPPVEHAHLRAEPRCQWCLGAVKLQVHHIVPFHKDPSKELDPQNLITLCMAPGLECHFERGHKGTSWLDFDPDIRRHCEEQQRRRRAFGVPAPEWDDE